MSLRSLGYLKSLETLRSMWSLRSPETLRISKVPQIPKIPKEYRDLYVPGDLKGVSGPVLGVPRNSKDPRDVDIAVTTGMLTFLGNPGGTQFLH